MATIHMLPKGDGRPVIQLSTDLADVVDLALSAMASDVAVYQRDGRLVHVVRVTEAEADDSAVAGTPQIRSLMAATLRERLTRHAVFRRFDSRAGNWKDSLPSDHIVHALIERGEYPGIRPLIGVIESPSMRPDGSIIQTPGYDRATGYLYAPSVEFPVVPESPTKEDASKALAELHEPFVDFPFAGEAHRSSTIAALLTIIARPAIMGSTPAIVHDANVRGSGKTLKADAVSTIATGRPTAKMNFPDDDVELEKILASYALRGATVISFDNVVRTFGGGPLDRCLTAGDMVELRPLGKSEIPALRWRAVVMATGNNVALAGDTSRRVLISRLESPLENPEERQEFTHHPLQDWVTANRPRLAVAALTIMRAWVVAGKPSCGCRSWGSFEAWSAMVPPAIVFAGGADPMATRPAATGEVDAEKAALIAVLDGLSKLDTGGRGLTCKAIVDALYSADRMRGLAAPDGYDDLREAIQGITDAPTGKPPNTQKLGKRLQRLRRRVVGGRFLDANPDPHTKIVRWRVADGKANSTVAVSAVSAVIGLPARVETVSDISRGEDPNNTRNHPHSPQATLEYPTEWDSEDSSGKE